MTSLRDLAVGRVLAQTTRAAALVLDAAHRSPTDSGARDRAALQEGLLDHADHLARAVTTHRTVLGSLTPPSRGVQAQGRELGASGLPRLRAAGSHPSSARAAEEHIAAYALALPDVSRALRNVAERAGRERSVAVRDRSEDAAYPWRMGTADDLATFIGHLGRAVRVADRLPRAESPSQVPRSLATDAPTAALRAALERHQVALRPAAPGQPTFGFAYVRPRPAVSC